MLHFIDFEVFSNDWLCVIIKPQTRTETVIVNDAEKLNEKKKELKDYNSTNQKIADKWLELFELD